MDGVLKKLNDIKNARRNKKFLKKIKAGFRQEKDTKIILAEGDSWFNYPIILTDIVDRMEKPRVLTPSPHEILHLISGGGRGAALPHFPVYVRKRGNGFNLIQCMSYNSPH